MRSGEEASSGRREIWEDSLTMERYPDLRTSLVGELAEYLGLEHGEVLGRCRAGTETLTDEWEVASPSGVSGVTEFYRRTDGYLYDLTWWHSLSKDESALAQVEALEAALEHRARKVMDFGGGIGSLGILLAAHDMDVTLAEINSSLRDYSRHRFDGRNFPVSILDTSSVPLPDSTFDFISAVDVMEHLPEPRETLAMLAAALKPGGTLYVHLPPNADESRPMHLWHDRERLLRDLDGCGLWLGSSEGSSLVLRKGEAPRYSLDANLELLDTGEGRVLLSGRPLAAYRLNRGAVGIIAALKSGGTASQVAAKTRLSVAATTGFLEGMVERRVLVREYTPSPARWPTASVIVPSMGRPSQTRECVESLLALDYPAGLLEVIVVDDASEVPLSRSLSDLPVKVMRLERNIGQSAARNLAAGEAQGEILAFTDNDCFVDGDWLRSLAARLCEPGADFVGGRVLSPPPDGAVARFESVRSPLDMGEVGSVVGYKERVAYIPSCNIAVGRDAFLEVGGFREEMLLGEDVDLVWRAAKAKRGVYYEPSAEVLHYHRTKLREFLRRRSDYASSEADLQIRHPETMRTMMFPVSVVLLLAAIPVLPVAWWMSLVLAAAGTVSISAEILGKKRRLRAAGVGLPVTEISRAVLRQHGASLYHLGANVTRYYSLPLLLLSLPWPALLPPVLTLMTVPAIVDHRRKRPKQSVATFTALYWLELASYQVGIWRGCIERRTVRPLLAKLRPGR